MSRSFEFPRAVADALRRANPHFAPRFLGFIRRAGAERERRHAARRPRARAGRRRGPVSRPGLPPARHLDRDSSRQHRHVLRRQDGWRPGHGHRVPANDVRRARHRLRQDEPRHGHAPTSRLTRAAPAAPTASSATAGRCAESPPKRGACCSSSAREQLGAPVAELTVRDGTISLEADRAKR